jgi:hypothetical protein
MQLVVMWLLAVTLLFMGGVLREKLSALLPSPWRFRLAGDV